MSITPTTEPQTGSPTSISQRSLAWSRKSKQKEKALHTSTFRQRGGRRLSTDGEEETLDRDPDFAYRSDEEPEPDEPSSDEEFSPQDYLDDWILSLCLDQRKMLAVILMESYKKCMKLNAKDAATETGSVVGFNEKTVHRYRNDFFQNEGHFTIPMQGKYERHCIYHGEGLNHKAAEWVREHAFVKGQPNMTAQSFCDWTKNTLLPSSHLPPHFPRTVFPENSCTLAPSPGVQPSSDGDDNSTPAIVGKGATPTIVGDVSRWSHHGGRARR